MVDAASEGESTISSPFSVGDLISLAGLEVGGVEAGRPAKDGRLTGANRTSRFR